MYRSCSRYKSEQSSWEEEGGRAQDQRFHGHGQFLRKIYGRFDGRGKGQPTADEEKSEKTKNGRRRNGTVVGDVRSKNVTWKFAR